MLSHVGRTVAHGRAPCGTVRPVCDPKICLNKNLKKYKIPCFRPEKAYDCLNQSNINGIDNYLLDICFYDYYPMLPLYLTY